MELPAKIEDLKYVLNGNHITPEPREIRLGSRDRGRMIVVDRKQKKQYDSFVLKLPDYFQKDDVLVLNRSKRVPGILKGTLEHNNAQVELQFVNLNDGISALSRIYPDHHVMPSSVICINDHKLKVCRKESEHDRVYRVEAIDYSLTDILKKNGIAINAFFSSKLWDASYFNPFYATKEGSIESPLAGLHFTPKLIKALKDKGVQIGYITLHSVGSWLPFLETNIDDHKVFKEIFEMPETTANLINKAKRANKSVVACGSTVMRTIESSVNSEGIVVPQQGESSLYIKPGYQFKIVNKYFTNFHQYKTSLMVLDAAFCGYKLLMETIEVAKERNYLFYEYGDAVFYI